MGTAMLQNLGVGLSAAIQAGAAVLKGGFQSAIALLSDASLWDGIRSSALSIAYTVKAIILDVAADMVSMLPGKNGVAKEWKMTAQSTQGLADAYQQNAGVSFDNVDFDKVIQPLIDTAGTAGSILGDTISQVAENLKNNTSLSEVFESLKTAAAGPAPLIGGARLYDIVPPEKKREFLPTNEAFKFDGGQGLASQAALLESVQKLFSNAARNAEQFLNPNGTGSGGGVKAADIKKSVDDSGLIKRLLTVLEQVETNTANLSPQGVYANF